MPRNRRVKFVAASVMLVFGVIVTLNCFPIAEGGPGWIGWMVIILSPVLYPLMAWMLIDRLFPDR